MENISYKDPEASYGDLRISSIATTFPASVSSVVRTLDLGPYGAGFDYQLDYIGTKKSFHFGCIHINLVDIISCQQNFFAFISWGLLS